MADFSTWCSEAKRPLKRAFRMARPLRYAPPISALRIAPVASESTRSFQVFVEVDDRAQTQQLMPGAFVLARISGLTFENATVVPRGSIENGRVFLYSNGEATPRNVTIVRHLLDLTIVTGLSAGDMVITSNFDALDEGTPVRLRGASDGETP